MRRRRLGRHGPEVSQLALGTMTFGAEADEPESIAMLDRFVEGGGTLVDLADVYADGESERIVGRWLAARDVRGQVVVATKARFRTAAGPDGVGLSRTHLRSALDASRRRLGIDVIDLYQCHAWDPLVPVAETVDTLAEMVADGHVRQVGISNVTGWQLERFRATAAAADLPLVSLQPQYNLLAREVEWELMPLCAEAGIGVLPWSPLGGGWLTGKYRPDEQPSEATRLGEDPERGVESWDRRANEATWRVVDTVTAIAAAHGASAGQVAIAWLLARPEVSSVILGARTLEQLEDNLGAADLDLHAGELDRLDDVSAPPTPDYPYGLLHDLDDERRQDT